MVYDGDSQQTGAAQYNHLVFEGSCRASCLLGKVVSAVMPAPVGARPDVAHPVYVCVCGQARMMKRMLGNWSFLREARAHQSTFRSKCGGGDEGPSNVKHTVRKKSIIFWRINVPASERSA
jgi:hypothetical protein